MDGPWIVRGGPTVAKYDLKRNLTVFVHTARFTGIGTGDAEFRISKGKEKISDSASSCGRYCGSITLCGISVFQAFVLLHP